MMALLKNRQFWLAVVALVQTIVLNYVGVPQEIWAAIDAILAVVIAAFTVEDVAKIKAEAMMQSARTYSEMLNRTVLELNDRKTK